jgi:uncharacterized protein (TIGR03437 family)
MFNIRMHPGGMNEEAGRPVYRSLLDRLRGGYEKDDSLSYTERFLNFMRTQRTLIPTIFLTAALLGTPAMKNNAYAQTSNPPDVKAVTNGASFASGYISPGSIGTIFGNSLSGCTEAAATKPLPTAACGNQTKVLVGSSEAPLFYVSPMQINFLVPKDTGLGAYPLYVQKGVQRGSIQVDIKRLAPGIFVVPRFGDTHGGFAAMQRHPDYSLIDFYTAAKQGDILIAYATGMGLPERVENGISFLQQPEIYVDDMPVQGLPAAETPGFYGLDQVAFVNQSKTGIHRLKICYSGKTVCSQEAEFPAAVEDAYAAFWLADIGTDAKSGANGPLANVPVYADGIQSGKTSDSGAGVAGMTTGRKSTARIQQDGFYPWEDEITAKKGPNFLRAVSAVNEPGISGTIYRMKKSQSPTVMWSYTNAPALEDRPAEKYWSQIGKSMTLLELMQWYGDYMLGGCGESKTFGMAKDSIPTKFWIKPGASQAFNDGIRKGFTYWDGSGAGRHVTESDSDPTLAGRGFRVEVTPPPPDTRLASTFVPLTGKVCAEYWTGVMYFHPTIDLSRISQHSAHELQRVFGIGRESPSPLQIMNIYAPVPVPEQLELEADKYWQGLPNGTLMRKYKDN